MKEKYMSLVIEKTVMVSDDGDEDDEIRKGE